MALALAAEYGKVSAQKITSKYAAYNGDSLEVLPTLPAESIHLSIYSPPFAGLYHYSSSERDLSNCRNYDEFFQHYEFFVREIARLTMPGRMTIVHCMDFPTGNTGCDHYLDLPGHIIALHEKCGLRQSSPRINVWKEPLTVRNRTLTKSLAHKSIVDDSCDCAVAGADYVLVFRKKGANPVPVTHPQGLMSYAGSRKVPAELLRYRGWKGSQIENRYSHWIWRQYASAFWDDVRLDRVLPYRPARDDQDEKHVHPLQLDVIERALTLWSNPGEKILTPFMGVGSEVYMAVKRKRLGIGIELKPSYYRQALKNIEAAENEPEEDSDQITMEFASESDGVPDNEPELAATEWTGI